QFRAVHGCVKGAIDDDLGLGRSGAGKGCSRQDEGLHGSISSEIWFETHGRPGAESTRVTE
ncbi:MAG: hypothetical protein ACK55I_09445, partial [bacterium]